VRANVIYLKPEREVEKPATGNGLNFSYHESLGGCNGIIKKKNQIHFFLFFSFENSNSIGIQTNRKRLPAARIGRRRKALFEGGTQWSFQFPVI
jgi:hypothetical protein